jgi:RHS repeat-associated protein
MFPAAKFGDIVIGVDLHMVMVPTPAGPVPTPLPHVFQGVVYDPAGAAIGAGLSAAFGGGGLVLVNGLPAGNTGMEVKGTPHLPTPPGTGFAPNDVPDHQGTLVTGSKTVSFSGSSAARLTSLVSSCNFPLNLPTSTCLAVPMGAPVLVGGPTSLDVMAAVTRGIRTKWFADTLKRVLNAGPRLSKLICFLTGHPVDVMTGEVLADAVDFTLPGPIPITFERNYYSRNRDDGPLGPGWHHPLDASVREAALGVKIRLPDGRERDHEPIAVGASIWDPVDRYALEHTVTGYRLTFWDGSAYHFEPVPGAPASHPLARITDRCDNAIELRYASGRLAQVIDSAGRKLRFTCSAGRLTAIRLEDPGADDGHRVLVRYDYDAEGRLAAARDPLGHAATYAYEGGVIVKETNKNGLSFYFEYDWYHPDGMCVRTWGDGGIHDRRITYDEHRHVTIVDDSRGGRTHYEGNAAGLVDREIDPTGCEKRYEWHPEQYRKTAEIDGLGNRTEWAYDARGNTVLERDALGHTTRFRYDDHNLPVERIDAAGAVWKRDYDARGNLTRAQDPLGNVTRCKHDRRGLLASVEDAHGRVLTLEHDNEGNVSAIVDREGHARRITHDVEGRAVEEVNPLGGETTITRDARGLPITVKRSDGSRIHMAYDAEANLIESADALGNVTRLRWGGFNKLVERTDPTGGVVRATYDTEEDLIAVTNEAGETYSFELDKAGRVVKERGFDGRAQEQWYDRAGRAIEIVNGRTRRTKLVRDALGRVVKQIVPRDPMLRDPLPRGEETEYTYDALGQLIGATNSAAAIAFVRDALGRVVEERAGDQVITSRHDAVGNRIGRRTSLGHETAYDHDGNGDLLAVTFGMDARWMDFSPDALAKQGAARAPWKAVFSRDATGQEQERRLPGGVVGRWTRDTSGRPVVHRVVRERGPVFGTGYQWTSIEQLAALIDTREGATRFEHDARSYLVAATSPDGTVQHRAPDAVGNVYRDPERWDRTYGTGGKLERIGGTRYEHDADGQLVAKIADDGKRWGYAWDHAGQLREVTRPDGEKVTFAYDALGRRVRKTFAGKTTAYTWDGNDLVHEITEGRDTVTWEMEPGTFAPLAKAEGSKRYGVVTDHLGAPRLLVDEAGEVAWQAQLDIYGVPRQDVMRTACPWRWPGQYEDEETGLYYNRFRYYDPESGRYISQDPIGLAGGLGQYSYVHDPLSWLDPFGLSACSRDNKRFQALKDFCNRYIQVGSQVKVLLTRDGMDHILARHHPSFWDGTVKATQSFFARGVSAERVEEMIVETLRANEDRIVTSGKRQIEHTIDGVDYVLGLNGGHVGQFYPR